MSLRKRKKGEPTGYTTKSWSIYEHTSHDIWVASVLEFGDRLEEEMKANVDRIREAAHRQGLLLNPVEESKRSITNRKNRTI